MWLSTHKEHAIFKLIIIAIDSKAYSVSFQLPPSESKEFDKDVIERHLAHVPRNKGRAAYNRAKYWDERVRLMDWWAAIVEPWINPEKRA